MLEWVTLVFWVRMSSQRLKTKHIPLGAFVAKWLVSALELATAMSSVAINTVNGNAFIIRSKINFGKSFIYFFGGEGWGGSEIYSV